MPSREIVMDVIVVDNTLDVGENYRNVRYQTLTDLLEHHSFKGHVL